MPAWVVLDQGGQSAPVRCRAEMSLTNCIVRVYVVLAGLAPLLR